jgi:cell division ATPase FtsA
MLNKTQKRAGCILANVGSETTSIVVFEDATPISLKIFPVGSNDITNDIALGLKVPIEEAEKIARDRVTYILKDVQVGTYNGQGIISYKRQTRKGSIDIERMLNHHPELSALAAQYRKPDTGFRVLRMK